MWGGEYHWLVRRDGRDVAEAVKRQRPQIGAIEPQKVECDVDRAARAPEKIVELRAAGLVGGDHLAIEDRLVDAKLGHDVVTEGRGDLPAQRIEPGEDIPPSRDKAAAPALDVAPCAGPGPRRPC